MLGRWKPLCQQAPSLPSKPQNAAQTPSNAPNPFQHALHFCKPKELQNLKPRPCRRPPRELRAPRPAAQKIRVQVPKDWSLACYSGSLLLCLAGQEPADVQQVHAMRQDTSCMKRSWFEGFFDMLYQDGIRSKICTVVASRRKMIFNTGLQTTAALWGSGGGRASC